jgi:hypothetical protein
VYKRQALLVNSSTGFKFVLFIGQAYNNLLQVFFSTDTKDAGFNVSHFSV